MKALRLARGAGVMLSMVVAAGLVVAACGGGEEPTVAPTSPPVPTATRPPGPPAGGTPAAPVPTPTPTLAPIAAPTPTPTPVGVQPKYGGILRVRLLQTFEPWDTYNRLSNFSTEHTMNIWSNLIALKAEEPAVLEQDLVERWEVSSDGKTITVFLAKDVQWHDGKPFTAADVVFNLNRAKSPPTPLITVNQGRMAVLQSFEAVDATTVKLTLSRVSASFLPNLAAPFMLMYPAHIVKESADIVKNPVGTGPFVVQEHQSGIGVKVKRYERYHRKDPQGRRLPFLDGVDFVFITDHGTSRAAFRTGRIDCGCGYDFTFQFGDELRKAVAEVKIVSFSRDSFNYFFNNRPPWNDVRVRKAIQLAMDFKEVRDLDRGGFSFYPPSIMLNRELGGRWGIPGEETLKLPGYRGVTEADRAEARRLFAAAGVDPARTPLKMQGTSSFPDVWLAMDAQFRKLGFKPEVIINPPGVQFTTALTAGDFDFSAMFGGRTIDDPADQIVDYVVTGRPLNYGKWSFPEVDRLAEEQDRTLDVARRAQLLTEFQRTLLDLAFFMPMVNSTSTWPLRKEVEGFRQGRHAVHTGLRLDTVWLNK